MITYDVHYVYQIEGFGVFSLDCSVDINQIFIKMFHIRHFGVVVANIADLRARLDRIPNDIRPPLSSRRTGYCAVDNQKSHYLYLIND
jgi:hypothetical protein